MFTVHSEYMGSGALPFLPFKARRVHGAVITDNARGPVPGRVGSGFIQPMRHASFGAPPLRPSFIHHIILAFYSERSELHTQRVHNAHERIGNNNNNNTTIPWQFGIRVVGHDPFASGFCHGE